jgi:hypothetical protein
MNELKKTGIWPQPLVSLVFFASVFIFFAHPIKHGDFWYHLNMGRWVVEHGGLPSVEPFTYTSPESPTGMEFVVIKGYWLSQTILFLIYRSFGFHGVILFNAALFALLFHVLWRILRYQDMEPTTGLLMLIPGILIAYYLDEVRPQTFSFLNALLVFHVLEKGFQKIKESPPGRPFSATHFIFMPPLMLLWANLHPGFILGYCIIGIYLLVETGKYALSRKERLSRSGLINFSFWSLTAFLASLINPNFIPVSVFQTMISWNPIKGLIIELESPWHYSAIMGTPYFACGLVGIAALTFAFMAASYRKVRLSHAILYLGFAAAAANALRFVMLFTLMSVAVSGRYAAFLRNDHMKRYRPVTASLCLIFSAIFLVVSLNRNYIKQDAVYDESLPVKAVDFMENRGLPQPVFNPFEWGGYISWRLYPRYRVFIDGRTSNPVVYEKYRSARLGLTKPVFEEYGINTVVFYPIYIVDRNVQPIVLSLIKDADWRLVYLDDNSVIFVREGSRPGLPSIEKKNLLDYLIGFGEYQVEKAPRSPGGYNVLGAIYFTMGEWDKAQRYLDKARALETEAGENDEWPMEIPGLNNR